MARLTVAVKNLHIFPEIFVTCFRFDLYPEQIEFCNLTCFYSEYKIFNSDLDIA
jgi:hypothetical protein